MFWSISVLAPKICKGLKSARAAEMRRLQKTSFAKFVRQNCRRKQFLIFTEQSIVAAPNVKMFSLMMRSIAPCAGRNKIMKERRFDYEEIFVTVYCIYYVDDAFAAYGICGLFRRSELRQLRSLPLGQLLLRKLRPLHGGLYQ